MRELLNLSREEKVFHTVLKSSVVNLLARGFGYLKSVAIAVFLGFSYQTDAFFMALSLLGIFLIFVDVFDSIGIPNSVSARQNSYEEFKNFFFYPFYGFFFSYAFPNPDAPYSPNTQRIYTRGNRIHKDLFL